MLMKETEDDTNSVVLTQKQTIYQWDSIESPEINPHIHDQLIYNTEGKGISDAGKTRQLH